MSANIIISSTGGSSGMTPTELHMQRILAGDIDSIRARLIPALESLHYTIITEDPLMAQRAERGWAKALMSNNILDYGTKLSITLKQVSPAIVRATFSYTVMHPWLTKGDHQTVGCEADTVVALATVRAMATTCSTCAGETTGDSRFCRFCGAPLAAAAPAELEVMRLTAGARAAHQTIVTGSIFVLVGLLMLLIVAFKGSAVLTSAFVMCSLFAVPGLITMLFGMRRLHVTLNPRTTTPTPLPSTFTGSSINANPARVATLPAHPFPLTTPHSVTEGTTELLHVDQTRTTGKTLRREELEARGDSTAA